MTDRALDDAVMRVQQSATAYQALREPMRTLGQAMQTVLDELDRYRETVEILSDPDAMEAIWDADDEAPVHKID